MKFSSCLVTEREAALTAGNIGIGVCHCGRPDRSACVLSPLLPNDKDGDDDQARRGQRSWRPRSPRFISTTTCPRRGSGSVNRQQVAVDRGRSRCCSGGPRLAAVRTSRDYSKLLPASSTQRPISVASVVRRASCAHLAGASSSLAVAVATAGSTAERGAALGCLE